jgi:hypothetical protein
MDVPETISLFNIHTAVPYRMRRERMHLPIRNGPRLLPGDMDSSIRLAIPVSSCFGDSCIDIGEGVGYERAESKILRLTLWATVTREYEGHLI